MMMKLRDQKKRGTRTETVDCESETKTKTCWCWLMMTMDDDKGELVMVGMFILTGESCPTRHYARWSWAWC